MLLPDKTLISFGATGHNAVWTAGSSLTQPGTWAAAPDFPADPITTVYPAKILTLCDAPAVLQPNGRVLVLAGSLYRVAGPPVDFFSKLMQLFEYDPIAGTLTEAAVGRAAAERGGEPGYVDGAVSATAHGRDPVEHGAVAGVYLLARPERGQLPSGVAASDYVVPDDVDHWAQLPADGYGHQRHLAGEQLWRRCADGDELSDRAADGYE